MDEEIFDRPLLSFQQLALTVLKTSAQAEATLEDFWQGLERNLRAAHEAPEVEAKDVQAALSGVVAALAAAGLVREGESRRYRLTALGRSVLKEHPLGVDDTVLMQFDRFRRHLRAAERHQLPLDPGMLQYDEGFAAFAEGKSAADNPYSRDSAKHLAWENGWSEARDEHLDHHRTYPSQPASEEKR
jgi:ribosome modulation factor